MASQNSSTDNRWGQQKANRNQRLRRASVLVNGKIVNYTDARKLLETIIEPGDRVCLEGNNQKQADFLARELSLVDSKKIHNLHMIQSVVSLPEHIDLFENGIASRLDFSYSGPQSARVAKLVSAGKIQVGAIHTYLELYSRYFMDLTPRVSLVVAQAADKKGNLFTGPNTEDTPTIVEATAFKNGIVIAQVNELCDDIPRVDIPADWVDFVVESPKPHHLEPLFTRDPAEISEIQILMAMITIKGIYQKYHITRLNHGVGFNTAAIELILPTYASELGLKGKICQHWLLNPHPTLIPAIEDGYVESVFSPGSEIGMEEYIRARSDIFFNGPDGSMRSNRALAQITGHYACDLFIGSTLQIDSRGNSSTATLGRLAGFGGAPNFGADARGRRHPSETWLQAGQEISNAEPLSRGRKLVIQIVPTFQSNLKPTFVEHLDAWELAKTSNMQLPPIMVYGDDITHIITEEGIANLMLCEDLTTREQAIRGVAGYTEFGLKRDRQITENLRDKKVIQRPEDLGIDLSLATRDLLSAKSIKDLVRISNGLYLPPKQFQNW